MSERVHHNPNLIYSVGTQVVALRDIRSEGGRMNHPRGSVGVVVRAPADLNHSYRVRFLDGIEEPLAPDDIVMLAQFKEGEIGDAQITEQQNDLFSRVIYRCIVGSRAFGLDNDESDTDRRGIFLPPAELHWSLYGVPEQIDREHSQEQYWELQRFLVLALKANPNVLECLYTPIVESITPLGEELLAMRSSFLSRLAFQTYNGYVASQFKKMQTDLRIKGAVKWKHVMHLIRLLLSGITLLRDGIVPIRVDEHRETLLAIRRGELGWDETERWRLELHRQFDEAVQSTRLPDRPDYARANALLLRRAAGAGEGVAMSRCSENCRRRSAAAPSGGCSPVSAAVCHNQRRRICMDFPRPIPISTCEACIFCRFRNCSVCMHRTKRSSAPASTTAWKSTWSRTMPKSFSACC